MIETFTILPEAKDPLAEFERKRPLTRAPIMATGLIPMQEIPTQFLDKMSPEDLQEMAKVKAAGGIHYPTEPEDMLNDEVFISLIRHSDMVIDDLDEVLIPWGEATMRLDYPLKVVVLVPVKATAPGGVTRGDILYALHDAYKAIYEAEDASSPPVPIEDRGNVLNRGITEGAFGIWGHDMSDLILVWIDIHLIDGVYWINPVTEA